MLMWDCTMVAFCKSLGASLSRSIMCRKDKPITRVSVDSSRNKVVPSIMDTVPYAQLYPKTVYFSEFPSLILSLELSFLCVHLGLPTSLKPGCFLFFSFDFFLSDAGKS